MSRNSVAPNQALIFYFSFLLTGILGIAANPVFAQPFTSQERVQEIPLLERTYAFFWWNNDDEDEKKAVEETPKAVEPPEPMPTPEVPEKEMMEMKEEIVPVIPMDKPATEAMPEMKMQEVVPEIPPVAKPEAVETPEQMVAPEVVPEKKMMEVAPTAPAEEPVEKAMPVEETKPAMKMQEVVPEIPPVTKPEAVETPEQMVVPEVVPEKKMMEVAPTAPVEETKPAMKMQEAVPEVKVTSQGFFKGAKACEECHEGEFKIWKETKHYTSFRTAHREPKDSAKPSPKKILKNVAGEKRMKRNKTCYLCHFTLEQKDADAKPVAKSGTSCESCHGASSEWLALHDNYGGEGIKRMDETPEHKKERIAKSAAKGLIWPSMKYQVVENCMSCHGLAHPELSGDVLAKMLGAGHPINPDFEAVKYSQGSVRHRYTPEDINNNREMTEPEKAELFVIGHAAALVSAREAMSKSSEPKYTDAQNKRAKNAEAVLSLLTDIPEAQQLMETPSRSNALKLVNALAGKDLTGKVGSMLPAKSDYK